MELETKRMEAVVALRMLANAVMAEVLNLLTFEDARGLVATENIRIAYEAALEASYALEDAFNAKEKA